MTRRMWSAGMGAAGVLALSAVIAGYLAEARSPVLQGLCTYVTAVLVLAAVHLVEWYGALVDDAQVSKETLKHYSDEARS
jgi:hypothetical protein